MHATPLAKPSIPIRIRRSRRRQRAAVITAALLIAALAVLKLASLLGAPA